MKRDPQLLASHRPDRCYSPTLRDQAEDLNVYQLLRNTSPSVVPATETARAKFDTRENLAANREPIVASDDTMCS